MGHQGWLEKPYWRAAEMSEADARAKELGYEDYDDMMECLYEEAQERKFEREREDGF